MNTVHDLPNKIVSKRSIMKAGVVLCALLLVIELHAQEEFETTPKDPKAMEKIQTLRTAYISEKLGLTPEQAEKFWPVYREFTQERLKLREQLRDAQKSVDPNNPDPATQQRLVDLGLEIKQKELNLEKDYSGRLLKVISAQQVLNLRKAEAEFRQIIINQLQQRRMQQQRRENFREKQQLRRNN